MTLPANLPPGSTQDPDRPHVYWYPQPERLVIDAAQYAKPDPRDARIAELETAIYTLASHAIPVGDRVEVPLADWREMMTVALAGADHEPASVTVEVMAI